MTTLGNRILCKIFGPKTEAVRANWRQLRNEELHGLYTSVNTMVKSSEIRRMEDVACM
jgi:hypothetical protein